ncbi:lipopolysaccharide cholinephosphotransferase [Breznakia sp. PF5-3]|uniref:LicD family protein n=1 Tax=unclassified Breznakia TaxID=2623764 RepID=UPI002405E9F3|nr:MULTISPECIES: LicD family protein [unclassified Breznakia]MDL2276409.1 LicD family protein [Breznakia sp. OttesenSCG-928-G09]MDF9823795.1 lipopolysaccharide cholinephosphotransferase [Breznakia sp. PM6-1]MDF9834639.1 lipopolysaccharide cholinephosphotransferase [Breznakia sp. PF5-3]MDF9836744.1 lipopolysaccharide cholinephosphotransferase [Breznakia sp. PFB2-8]MDF9858807.1 lipopolysaccharide cholinephosphotransferase [Breznakia sp. PH5-24]
MKEYILKTNTDGTKVTVRDVQLVLLEMLKDIDEICRKHNIPYYLTGGSCLGAVRHDGFIPWDDDADIGMLYEDYVRFIEVLKQELDPQKYYFQCFDTHKEYNVCIPAMKIRKRGTYLKEVNTLLQNRCKDGDGLFIDVFLVDYIDERKWVDFLCRMKAYLYMGVITLFENIRINPVFLKKRFVRFSRRYSRRNKDSKLIGYDLNWTFNSPLHPVVYVKDEIYPVQYHKFEDIELPIPKNPKALLDIEISVNHMSYPPEKMQQPKHIVDINLNSEEK